MNLFRFPSKTLPVSLLLSVQVLTFSHAATYYVDSLAGNDANTGTAATTLGTEGPWQSLARLSRATIRPGDTVLLRCERIWRETLRVPSSGTATAPIRIGAYPMTGCTAKPVIDGSVKLPAHGWSRDAANRYALAFPTNILRNGQMNASTADWRVWSNDGSYAVTADSKSCAPGQAPCLSLKGGTNTTFGQISSTPFAVEAGLQYKVTLSYNIPAGKKARIVVRRDVSPWNHAAATVRTLTGAGVWVSTSFTFEAITTMGNARLDLESNGINLALFDNISLEPVLGQPLGLYVASQAQNIAHHPHPGHDVDKPGSMYITIPYDAPVVTNTTGTKGSAELPLSTHASVPTVANMLSPDTSVYIRTSPWTLERKSITSVSNGVARLDSVTQRHVRANFGYFFAGALWMLDRPGEWVYDASSRSIYVKPSDNLPINNRAEVIHLAKGIDLSNLSHIEISGIHVRRTGIGADLSGTKSVQFNSSRVEDTAQQGIQAHASTDLVLYNNQFYRTGGDAIAGMSPGTATALRMTVTDNSVYENGVRMAGDQVVSIPTQTTGAIASGKNSRVERNRVTYASYNGIYPLQGSTVTANVVEYPCEVLDDCGGIYTYGANNGSRIEQNVIRHIRGNLNGIPGEAPHAVGIYLDELSSDVTVARNTVQNAQYGIQLHNAARNIIDRNVLYGNRTYQLWLQEGSKVLDPKGDVVHNTVTSNQYVPIGNALGVFQETAFVDTSRFATHDMNVHSALVSPIVSRERLGSLGLAYGFSEWRTAKVDGTPRNLDPNGKEIKQTGYTSYLVDGATLIPPIKTSALTTGWSTWNASTTRAVYAITTCGATPCIHLTPGGSSSLLATPNFAVQQGQWYRLTFDMKTKVAQQKITISPRRAGGKAADYSMIAPQQAIFGSTTWKRYTLNFQSLHSVSTDLAGKGELGARIDFQGVQPGLDITLANVELVPLKQVGNTLYKALLVNPGTAPTQVNCPSDAMAAGVCHQFVSFASGSTVSWPRLIPAHASEVVYTRNASLVDSDGDAVADVEDECPGTASNLATNAKGCPMPFIQ